MKLHRNFLICLLAVAAVLLCLVALPKTAHAASESDCIVPDCEETASGTCGETLTWTLYEDGTLHIFGIGAMTNYTKNTMPWYEHIGSIQTVVVDPGVTTISNYAFYNCTYLASITIPDSVTSIGNAAFRLCKNLVSVTVPDSVISIGNEAFRLCTSLTSINIPDSVTSIGWSTFYGCEGLTRIKIPDSVSSIGDYAFYDCTGLTNINIPGSITTISDYLFAGCSGLSHITIPAGVTAVGEGAFAYCYGLTGVTIPNSVTNLGDSVFWDCPRLSSVSYCGTNEQWTAIEKGSYNDSLTNATLQFHNYENCICTVCGATAHSWVEAGCTTPKTCSVCGATEGSAPGHDMQETSVEVPAGCETTGKTAVYTCANGCGKTEGGEEIPALGHSFENDTCAICQHYNGPLTFVLNEAGDGYIISDCDESASGELVIPATYNGLPVTGIGNGAFYFRYNLTSITIPNSITSIGISAFSDCSSLSSITIPDSVTGIGNGAFVNCKSLTSIVIPDGVSVISSSMFYSCESLSSITLPDSVTSVEQRAFAYCDNLTNITLPDSVTSIGDAVFYHCVGLESIIIPEGIASIGVDVFNNCRNLTDVTIPNSVTSISKWAFYNCSSLASVTYCGTQEQWDAIEIDSNNNPLRKATLQFHNYENCVCTVCGATAHTWVEATCTAPKTCGLCGVTEGSALGHDMQEVSVEVPAGCETTGKTAVYTCANGCGNTEGGEEIPATGHNYENNFCTICQDYNGPLTFALNETGDGYIVSDCDETATGELVIPATYNGLLVTDIGSKAFYDCKGLTSITIPDGVTSIGKYAFYSCTGLISINIPDSVTSIGDSAFVYANGLLDVYITDASAWCKVNFADGAATPMIYGGRLHIVDAEGNEVSEIILDDTITVIPNRAFQGCTSLTSITLPANVTTIGNYAFSRCTSLTSITLPANVTTIGNYAFYGCTALAGSITIPDSVTGIGEWAFYDCRGLSDVYITDASAWCKIRFGNSYANPARVAANLHFIDREGKEVTEIVLDDSVKKVPEYGFINCTYLTSVTIPDSVIRIGERAFYNCTGLTSITIPDSVTIIGDYAFFYCYGLTSITIPNSITSIGEWTFAYCYGLNSITIPNSITSIGEGAFFNCSKMTSLTIGTSVASIGNSAFDVCVKLRNVTYCGTQEAWDAIAMGDDNEYLTDAALQFHNFEEGICIHCGEIGVLASGNCGENVTWELLGDGTLIIDGSGKMEDYYFHFMDPNIADPPPWYDIRALIKNIVLRSGVTRIGHYAFNGCSNLESVTIPASIESIGIVAFTACFDMEAVYITDLAAWCNIDFDFNYYPEGPAGPNSNPLKWSKKLYLNGEEVKDLVIPDGVTTIRDNAFYFGYFDRIIIPSSVQTIGAYAFYDCYVRNNSITIPSSVTNIGTGAFGDCSSLKNVTYCGTQTQWNAIAIGSYNDYLLNATLQLHDFENGYCSICGQKELVMGDIDGNEAVTHDDAIYLLLHTLFGEEAYPLNGAEGDIDCNGKVDGDDAVYLLLHSLFGNHFYPLTTPVKIKE